MNHGEVSQDTPTTYLSCSAEGARMKWRVIHQGLPICADKDSFYEAAAAFNQMVIAAVRNRTTRMHISDRVWFGGKFMPMDSAIALQFIH